MTGRKFGSLNTTMVSLNVQSTQLRTSIDTFTVKKAEIYKPDSSLHNIFLQVRKSWMRTQTKSRTWQRRICRDVAGGRLVHLTDDIPLPAIISIILITLVFLL